MNSRDIRETMCKKQGKIRIFTDIESNEVSRDRDFMVNGIVKPTNIEESDPI